MNKEFFAFSKKLVMSNFNILNNPLKLSFSITSWCNLKCKICDIWKRRPKNELSLEEIRKFSEINNFFSWVSLTGGEPFLRKDIADIVTSFYENSKNLYLINIPTNGSMPDTVVDRVNEMLDIGIPKIVVTVSLDGPKYMHDRVRGTENSWDKAIETVKSLREVSKHDNRLESFIAFTLSPLNVSSFEETYGEVKGDIDEIVASDFHINIFHQSAYYSNTNFKVNDPNAYTKNLLQELEKISEMKGNNFKGLVRYVEDKYLLLARKYVETGRTPVQCKAMDMSILMDSLGNVLPCVTWNNILGNVRDYDYDLRKVLSSENSRSAKDSIKNMQCPNCWTPCEANQMILGNLPKIIRD